MSMVGIFHCIVYSLIAFYFILHFFLCKKYSSILYKKRYGDICLVCSDYIPENNMDETLKKMDYSINNIENFKLCGSCERDEKLKSILTTFNTLKFNRIILSYKFDKYSILFIASAFLFVIPSYLCDILYKTSTIPYASVLSSSIIILSYLLMIYRIFICRK